MAGIDDLKTAVAAVAAGVTQAVTDINTAIALIAKLKASGGLSDADAEALATTLNSAVTGLATADTALKTSEG